MTSAIFVDPSIAGPDVLFSTGQVSNGEEQFFPTVPDIAGSADRGWNITQWSTQPGQIFDPATVVRADPRDADPLLGAALASWHTGTAQGGASLAMYGAAGDVTFRLGVSGGTAKDTFLQSTGYAAGSNSFDRQITFQAQERLVSASAGTGTAIAFNGFTVFFNAGDNPRYSASLPQTEMFLQVPLTDFRGEPGMFTTLTPGNTYQQIYNLSSWTTAADGGQVADESTNYLAFAADTGALHTVRIDLNQALLRMIRVMAAQNPSLASDYLDMSRWSLGSVYSGVETGGGDGTGAASLGMDIAHVSVTRDGSAPVSSDKLAASTVQSIDDGNYAESENAARIDTLTGAHNTVRLAGRSGTQDFTGRGDNTVLVGSRIDATLHGLGTALSVAGDAGTDSRIAVDGDAALRVTGTFGTLSVDSRAAAASIDATVAAARLVLGGDGDTVSIRGSADATLSGAGIRFAAGAGTVALAADGARIDANGTGTQTLFLNSHDATVSQTGTGSQVVVGQPTAGGALTLQGGAGTQTVWTGGSDATISANGSGTLQLFVQAGSHSAVTLGGENTTMDVEGGSLVMTGGATGGSARLSVHQGSATVQGGAESLVATLAGGAMAITAGSGDQVVFGGDGALVAMGSHTESGRQTIVNNDDPARASVVFGGRTAQTIWTGNASDTIVSSTEAGDASGRIDAVIQGGVSAYWGGVENASLCNLNGELDAFLSGTGAVSILADMGAGTRTVLHGFAFGQDSLSLQGVTDPSAVRITQNGGSTELVFNNSRVLLDGIAHVGLAQLGANIVVSG